MKERPKHAQVASFVCTTPAVPGTGPVNLYISLTGGKQWILAGIFSYETSTALSTPLAPSPVVSYAPLEAPVTGPQFCVISATFMQPSGPGSTMSAFIDGVRPCICYFCATLKCAMMSLYILLHKVIQQLPCRRSCRMMQIPSACLDLCKSQPALHRSPP